MLDPLTLAACDDAVSVRKRPIAVTVRFARDAGTCDTLEGPVRYGIGDALITGAAGESWPVALQAFLHVYAPTNGTLTGCDGQYIKVRNGARAIRLKQTCEVKAGPMNDTLRGKVGDWLLAHEDGSFGIVDDAIFRATYEAI